MKIRADIVKALRAGLSDAAIIRQFHVDSRTAAKARAALGLPKAKPGKRPAASLEQAFRDRVEPAAGGHLRWAGHWSTNGVPAIRYRGQHLTAYRIAFRLRTGREAEGNARPTCDYDGCVEPTHVQDAPERAQARATYAAIFGEEAPR